MKEKLSWTSQDHQDTDLSPSSPSLPYIPTQTPEENEVPICSNQTDNLLSVWLDVWSGDLQA